MSGGFFLHGALGSYNERLVLETGGKISQRQRLRQSILDDHLKNVCGRDSFLTLPPNPLQSPRVEVPGTVVHAHAYAARHLTLAMFSSIPTEFRHASFKLDMRHAFLGYRVSKGLGIHLTAGLGRIVSNAALDGALVLHHLQCVRKAHQPTCPSDDVSSDSETEQL